MISYACETRGGKDDDEHQEHKSGDCHRCGFGSEPMNGTIASDGLRRNPLGNEPFTEGCQLFNFPASNGYNLPNPRLFAQKSSPRIGFLPILLQAQG